ncbi:MAG TPA: endonuclease domain-containing protein [Candidatus Agrococcus pullicola]|uniref:Endonuclease domain-containing protein n=1 Tax=Candidatus Agrococcus pullicola TaxID=2838429 RepID=A0A9D2C9A9_9MICO|nr:endonuclease domain-containing protein [Candidatus Agrococcus pullicola]
MQIQVSYRGGRLDLVIDGWLCIEVDGSEFHDVGKQASRDRRRNTQLVRDGYRWHRFGYADVVHRLDETIEVIRILLRQGRPSIVQDS